MKKNVFSWVGSWTRDNWAKVLYFSFKFKLPPVSSLNLSLWENTPLSLFTLRLPYFCPKTSSFIQFQPIVITTHQLPNFVLFITFFKRRTVHVAAFLCKYCLKLKSNIYTCNKLFLWFSYRASCNTVLKSPACTCSE